MRGRGRGGSVSFRRLRGVPCDQPTSYQPIADFSLLPILSGIFLAVVTPPDSIPIALESLPRLGPASSWAIYSGGSTTSTRV